MSGKKDFTEQKNWWAPVWKGLVMDDRACHFERMGNALWLFLYFLINANRRTGILVRKVRTISVDTGIQRRRIFQWLNILREGDYISTKSSGRCLVITIRKWKPLGKVLESAPQKCQIPHLRDVENRTSPKEFEAQKAAWVKKNSEIVSAPKKNTIKKNILKSDIENKMIDFENLNPSAFKTREELLAYDLAKALHDLPAFPLYLSYARKYPESLLREILGRAREVPPSKIKKNYGALFNYLIQRHGQQPENGPGH